MVSVYDVAKIAGVSATTVSNVLNGHGRFSEKTRDRVISVAQGLGYITNVNARNLKVQRTNTVGIVIPDVSNDYASEIVVTLERSLRTHGISSFICNTSYDEQVTTDCIRELKQRNVDGLFFVSCETLGDISLAGDTPCAIISHAMSAEPQRWFMVKNDMRQIVYDQMQTLYDHGCRRIAFLILKDSMDFSSDIQPETGYRSFLDDHGLPFDQRLYLAGKHRQGSRADARGVVMEAIAKGIDFDGIVAFGDRLALGACEALDTAGVAAKSHVRVIGMDNSLYSRFGARGISTVSRNQEMMAHAAVGAMLAMVEGKEPVEREIVIPHQVIERASTLEA